eukprot:557528-Rhodomonas_salina.3
MSGTDLAPVGTRTTSRTRPKRRKSGRKSRSFPISLRPRCAMSGTDLAYSSFPLRPRYAMSGTDLAYGATSEWRLRAARLLPGPTAAHALDPLLASMTHYEDDLGKP